MYSIYFNNTNFVIENHNDILHENDIFTSNKITNNTINILNPSSNSVYKGSELTTIIKEIKKYKNYTINFYIININFPSYNENELFKLLISYNIHGLTYLNKWGETWCYSLTKGLISELPILYNNFGVFKERIPNNEKYIKVYETENEYNNDINKENLILRYDNFLDYIISKKEIDILESSNFSITKSIFYNKLFSINKKIDNKNIVIITSKIITNNVSYTYSNIRSIYTSDERFQQTLKTIESIKKYINDVFIIIIDNSILSNEQINIINSNVDLFINVTNNSELNYFTDKCIYKGFGELAQLLFIFNNYLNKLDVTNVKNLFKISGRYIINDNIDFMNLIDTNIFKKNNLVTDRDYYYTCFFKIIISKIDNFYTALLNMFKNKDKYYGMDFEVILPIELNHDFTVIDKLNITQYISVWNEISNI